MAAVISSCLSAADDTTSRSALHGGAHPSSWQSLELNLNPDEVRTHSLLSQAFRLNSLLKTADVPSTVFAARSADHSKLNNDMGLPDDPATKALDAFVAGLLKK